jgi:hypothetical protein
MYDKISTKLLPEAVSFDLPLFNEKFEGLSKGVNEITQTMMEKADSLQTSYLKFQ